MPNNTEPTPNDFAGVMISSTFTDLKLHRAALMDALRKQKLHPVAMEDYVTKPDDDVISSSLNMVKQGRAYIGLISKRYGGIEICETRNPNNYSVTRLEYEEAQRLNLPTLIFIMGKKHLVLEDAIEFDPEKRQKLEDFRIEAKKGRIYVEFNSIKEFETKAIHAVSELYKFIEEKKKTLQTPNPTSTIQTLIPQVPNQKQAYQPHPLCMRKLHTLARMSL